MKNFILTILKSIFLCVLFIVVFIFVFPKEAVYNLAIESLSKENIHLISASKNISLSNIYLNDTKVYLSGALVATIKSADVGVFGSEVKELEFIGSFHDAIPKIKNISIGYDIDKLCVVAGGFGKLIVKLDIKDKKIIVQADIKSNVYEKYKMIFGQFKKLKQGYIYEYNL